MLKDVIFKFSMMSPAEDGTGFVLVSNGAAAEYRGVDKEGNPQVISFDLTGDPQRRSVYLDRIQGALYAAGRQADSQDLEEGLVWSFRRKLGGLSYDSEGLLNFGSNMDLIRQEALHLLMVMQRQCSPDSRNCANIQTLIERSPFFASKNGIDVKKDM